MFSGQFCLAGLVWAADRRDAMHEIGIKCTDVIIVHFFIEIGHGRIQSVSVFRDTCALPTV